MRAKQYDTAEARGIEEAIYQAVAEEIASGIRRDGLWAKAIAEAGGSIEQAKARYIQLRAQSLIDEAELFKKAKQAELARKRAEDEQVAIRRREAQVAEEKRQRALKAGMVAGKLMTPLWKFVMWYFVISAGVGLVMLFPEILKGQLEVIPPTLAIGGVFWWLLRKLRDSN